MEIGDIGSAQNDGSTYRQSENPTADMMLLKAKELRTNLCVLQNAASEDFLCKISAHTLHTCIYTS